LAIDQTIKNIFDKVICIDAGHGETPAGVGEPGAVDPVNPAEGDFINSEEYKLNLIMVAKVEQKLRAKGFSRVIQTVKPGQFLTLGARCSFANNNGACLFISCHHNAMGNTSPDYTQARGIETFSFPGSEPGALLRDSIHKHLIDMFPKMVNRGPQTANFAVLRGTHMPAALVEYGFLTNVGDEILVNSDEFKEAAAEATAEGIKKHLESYLKK
jgi:N-acetylmuramoyl-L-alanine amidase